MEFDQWQQKGFDSNDTVRASQWYADRGSPDPAMEPEPANDVERRAAWLAARHDNTPGIIHFDSLGRPTYSVANYGGGVTAAVRSERDLTGRFSRVYDQAQREVGSGFAAMPGIQIFSESAERGGSWAFINVLGAVVRTWDDKGRKLRTEYDVLHRPLSAFVQEQGQAEILFNHIVYGDRHPDAVALNLLGVPHLVFDQGGMIRVPELDFKGNPHSADRILARDYQQYLDWSAVAAETQYGAIQAAAEPDLEMAEVFTSTSLYDALNRPTRVTLPDGTVLVPTYNEIGLLARLQAQLRGNGALIEFLKEQDYNAKGQRQFARYGNDLLSRYFYDPQRFRLTNLLTYDADADPSTDALQDLHYTYDAVGNMTTIRDDAQQTYYFNNAVVKPESNYEYDALYQLVRATGREHAGGSNDTQRTHADLEFMPQLPHPNNAAAVRTYTEEYEYDPLGNIKIMRHHYAGPGGAVSGWTCRYRYAYEEQPANRTNRLSATSMPGDPVAGPFSATYRYDAYGNIAGMPHLASLEWNFGEQLRQVDLGGGGTAYYVYGAGGQRLRKVVERNGTTRLEWIFLGPVLLYRRRRRDTNALQLERWTVHLADNTGLIAQVDTKTVDANNFDPANPLNTPLIRYQYGNHLGSTTLETDENGIVVAYEEYHPYGTSAYRSARPGFDLSLRRFRFSGKERDDETGLYYFGGRYYAAWLGRWTSSDPIGIADGFNLYKYCRNNPVMLKDPDGLQTREVTGSPALSDPNQEAAARAELESTHHIRITRMHFGTLPSGASGWIADEYTSAEEGGGPPAGGGAASSVGVEAVRTNPEGHVHEVAQNFDDAKIAAYQERILNDRAVATRSAPPGGGSRTADIRAQNQQLRDNFEASLPGGQRPAGTDIDHTVELQDIGRHNNTVRPQDHRVQQSSPNRSQGSSQQKVNAVANSARNTGRCSCGCSRQNLGHGQPTAE